MWRRVSSCWSPRIPATSGQRSEAGLRAAYVTRPLEYGSNQRPHRITDGEFDFTATDFLDLADQLGA